MNSGCSLSAAQLWTIDNRIRSSVVRLYYQQMLESFSKSGFDYQDGVICLQTRNLIINIYTGGGVIFRHQTSIGVDYGRIISP